MEDFLGRRFGGMAPIHHWVYSLWRFLRFQLFMLNMRIREDPLDEENYKTLIDRDGHPLSQPTSGGLVILIHGHNRPSGLVAIDRATLWNAILSNSNTPYTCCASPMIDYEDSERNRTSTGILYVLLERYTKAHPTSPILIVGMGVGGRIAMGLMYHSRHLKAQNRIHAVTIGTPLFGTVFNNMTRLITRFFYNDFISRELTTSDEQLLFMEHLFASWTTTLTAYHFYGRTDWLMCPPWRCVYRVGTMQALDYAPHEELPTHPDVLAYLANYTPGRTVPHFY